MIILITGATGFIAKNIAKYDNDSNRLTDGLLNSMKLIRAIPTSPNSFANCIVLSQLYPSLNGDGYDDAGSLYCANLHSGISQTVEQSLYPAEISPDDHLVIGKGRHTHQTAEPHIGI